MKTELRLRLFLGSHVKAVKKGDENYSDEDDDGQPKIDGIVQLVGSL